MDLLPTRELTVSHTSCRSYMQLQKANEFLNYFVTWGPITCLCTGALSTLRHCWRI